VKRRLAAELEARFGVACEEWARLDGTARLFARDASLWTGGDEASWLGWLDAPESERARLELWRGLAGDGRNFDSVLVLGMGGSSLAPEVQRLVVGRPTGAPAIEVLDSIHPDAVAATAARLDLGRTLVVVASKSGSTLEPNLLLAHFEAGLAAAVGAEEAPRRIVAITDPGSSLDRAARENGFRRVVAGEPTIGGRFSALSPFGLVPAALGGLDVEAWLGEAGEMAERCRRDDPAANPGVALGLALAAAAAEGRDKLTLVAHRRVAPLATWLEQLVAESTGKGGKAILPVAGEPLGEPEGGSDDRLFVALRFAGALAPGDDERLDALAAAGHPVLEIDLGDPIGLGAEFYRWEIATAVAGARLGVNPFDQPDVESAKIEARKVVAEIERTGRLPDEEPLATGDGWALLADARQARLLKAAAGPSPSAVALLAAHLRRLAPGDYLALLAFCAPAEKASEALDAIRDLARARFGVATTAGIGPRYLHSTGQAHKGGPDSGLFVLFADRPRHDLPVPGQSLSFGQAIAAQARGDHAALVARGRRAVRVELDGSADDLLPALAAELAGALDD